MNLRKNEVNGLVENALEIVTARSYLEQITELRALIKNNREYMRTLRERTTDTSARIKEIQVQTSRGKNSSTDASDEIVDTQREILKMVTEQTRIERECMIIINKIWPLKFRNVLINHYVIGMTLEKTAEAMEYSYKGIWNLNEAALIEFEKLFYKST